jgi:hypothetical protein
MAPSSVFRLPSSVFLREMSCHVTCRTTFHVACRLGPVIWCRVVMAGKRTLNSLSERVVPPSHRPEARISLCSPCTRRARFPSLQRLVLCVCAQAWSATDVHLANQVRFPQRHQRVSAVQRQKLPREVSKSQSLEACRLQRSDTGTPQRGKGGCALTGISLQNVGQLATQARLLCVATSSAEQRRRPCLRPWWRLAGGMHHARRGMKTGAV